MKKQYDVGDLIYIGAISKETGHYGTTVAQVREVQSSSKLGDDGKKIESRSYVVRTAGGKDMTLEENSSYSVFSSSNELGDALKAHYTKIVSERLRAIVTAKEKFGVQSGPVSGTLEQELGSSLQQTIPAGIGGPVPTPLAPDDGYIYVELPDGTKAKMKKPEGI